jgi:hypothetical protein
MANLSCPGTTGKGIERFASVERLAGRRYGRPGNMTAATGGGGQPILI